MLHLEQKTKIKDVIEKKIYSVSFGFLSFEINGRFPLTLTFAGLCFLILSHNFTCP